MRKTKFWLFQIVMLVMLSLLFGSPVFAGPPDHAKGGGAETSKTAHDNHSGGHAQGGLHADNNAAFMGVSTGGGGGTGDPATCPEGTFWLDINGNDAIDEGECMENLFSF